MKELKCYSCDIVIDELSKDEMPIRAYCESCAMDKAGV
jgi:hypothetical protein